MPSSQHVKSRRAIRIQRSFVQRSVCRLDLADRRNSSTTDQNGGCQMVVWFDPTIPNDFATVRQRMSQRNAQTTRWKTIEGDTVTSLPSLPPPFTRSYVPDPEPGCHRS
ncbi:2-acyl-glycerophospho-ethanolamine acyltransferase [Anopheles sinensis]|uniref:2-acyl-glycerophospho-ethanolamine acyltransferase n=1 Tax=Anopheles sinensis TaxID=74873 RepID=A0A084VGC4_ANOSI|nr:2-acyl-glycerophospho-ethanolamine acyltransferase [Anopheles sinensis]